MYTLSQQISAHHTNLKCHGQLLQSISSSLLSNRWSRSLNIVIECCTVAVIAQGVEVLSTPQTSMFCTLLALKLTHLHLYCVTSASTDQCPKDRALKKSLQKAYSQITVNLNKLFRVFGTEEGSVSGWVRELSIYTHLWIISNRAVSSTTLSKVRAISLDW